MRVREAFLGELVNVWRLNNFVTHEAVVRPGLVIGKDVNNIGRLRITESGCEDGNENEYTLHARTMQQVGPVTQGKRLEKFSLLG